MSEPIISPLIIYLIHLFSTIYKLCPIVMVVVLFASAITFGMVDSSIRYSDDEKEKIINKWKKRYFLLFLITAVLFIFVPDEDTMIKMVIASYITPENFTIVRTEIIDLIKDIAEAIHNI
jgi:uncharacterized membrane protein YjgN (DUF898 family)